MLSFEIEQVQPGRGDAKETEYIQRKERQQRTFPVKETSLKRLAGMLCQLVRGWLDINDTYRYVTHYFVKRPFSYSLAVQILSYDATFERRNIKFEKKSASLIYHCALNFFFSRGLLHFNYLLYFSTLYSLGRKSFFTKLCLVKS